MGWLTIEQISNFFHVYLVVSYLNSKLYVILHLCNVREYVFNDTRDYTTLPSSQVSLVDYSMSTENKAIYISSNFTAQIYRINHDRQLERFETNVIIITSIVYVLPLEVCPYTNIVALYPFNSSENTIFGQYATARTYWRQHLVR